MSKWIVDIHGEIEGDYELICKAESTIPLDKVKQARKEIADRVYRYSGSGNEVTQAYCDGFKASLEILDKLIAESEE